MTSLAIEELPPVIKEDVEDYLETHPRSPAARLRPRMGMIRRKARDGLSARWGCAKNSNSEAVSRSATTMLRLRCLKVSRRPKRLITCRFTCQTWRHCERRSRI